jgi:putative ATP-dependent endonuclease of OLD family
VNDFKIPWFIFSDGEYNTVSTVRKAVLKATGQDFESVRNVIILDQGNDYERHLISSGYTSIMIQAINKYEKVLRDEIDPEGAQRDPREYFERYIEDNNHKPAGTKKSGQICETCGRPLSEQVFNDYDGEEGTQRALLDVCQRGRNKAKYASLIAQEIVSFAAPEKVVPPKVNELFVEVNRLLQLHQEV